MYDTSSDEDVKMVITDKVKRNKRKTFYTCESMFNCGTDHASHGGNKSIRCLVLRSSGTLNSKQFNHIHRRFVCVYPCKNVRSKFKSIFCYFRINAKTKD